MNHFDLELEAILSLGDPCAEHEVAAALLGGAEIDEHIDAWDPAFERVVADDERFDDLAEHRSPE